MTTIQFYRALVIVNGAVPLLMLAWDGYHRQLGANAVNNALHVTGILSLVFLFLSLAITPLRWLTGWGGWIAFRRALGLYGFFYSLVHLAIYIGFDRALNISSTLHEIWVRRFLQVGAVAVFLMVPLAVTSTNSMIQWMGSKKWKQLHRLAYVVAALGVVHFYMLVKSDVRQPLAFGAVLTVLLGVRFGRQYFEVRRGALNSESLEKRAPLVGVSSAVRVVAAGATIPHRPWKGQLRVGAIIQETPDVKTFRLTSVDGGEFPFNYLPGQFLNIQLTIDGRRVNRSYTIASSPTRRDACELTIKREPLGLASRFLHDQLKIGDVVNVSAPAGKFVFTGKEADGVLLISGGVGITPLMSIVRFLTDRAWSGNIYFLIVARTERDLIFRDEIEELKQHFPRLKVCATLTRCGPDSMWNGDRGRATEEQLRRFVPDVTRIPTYLCGPNEMMDATRELLLRMGVPEMQIKTEAFVSRKAEISSELEEVVRPVNGHFVPSITEAVVSFARSQIQTKVSSESSVLEAAESSCVELPYECRSGICGQCKTRLIDGTVVMDCEDALSPSEKASGWILACQARPLTNLIVDA